MAEAHAPWHTACLQIQSKHPRQPTLDCLQKANTVLHEHVMKQQSSEQQATNHPRLHMAADLPSWNFGQPDHEQLLNGSRRVQNELNIWVLWAVVTGILLHMAPHGAALPAISSFSILTFHLEVGAVVVIRMCDNQPDLHNKKQRITCKTSWNITLCASELHVLPTLNA